MSSRAPIGHLAVSEIACCTNQGCKSLIPSHQVDSWYLFFVLKMSMPELKALGSGTTFTEISLRSAQSFQIPFAPFEQQKRIAAILNEQLAAVEQARAAAEKQLEAARALPAAYLHAVFNSPEAQKWPKEALGEVGEIVSGITLGRHLGEVQTRSVPYLRVANVKDGYLDLSDVYEIQATDTEIEKLRLKFGDLLLTEGGDADKLGRGTFWKEQIPECIHQNHIFRVRFELDRFSPGFVAAQIGSPYGKAYFLAHAKQTTGIATINQKVLAAFPLMAPPLTEQQRLIAQLNEEMGQVERMRRELDDQLTAINRLPAALLRRAFSGEP
jgi:type I restriction enzyme S subunit